MYPDLKNKVVMITGASGNIGEAVTQHFAELGARLALVDRTCQKLVGHFGEHSGDGWLILEGDITQKQSVAEMVNQAVTHLGGIDVLINVAGGFAGGDPIHQADESTWDHLMDLNAKSVFLMSRAAAGVMVESGMGGSIITIGARPGLAGEAGLAVYSAAKSAMLRLTEAIAEDLKPHGVRANAIIPMNVDTPANRSRKPEADFSKWVTPQSLAGIIAFLASDASRDISGASIPVYGR
jgi:NAD(P)-dependent dehydrogenase (short-subunit alcohol dehydrogenase family)